MSWSLEIRNGDLTLSGTHLGQVTGGRKLVQDLRCTVMEPRGNDDMHPLHGSTIDGGRDENGQEVQSVVGARDWQYASLMVMTEIRRIAGEYQRKQLARADNDRYRFGSSTLSNSELLISIRNIEFMQATDTLIVSVNLQTGTGDIIDLALPIATGTIL